MCLKYQEVLSPTSWLKATWFLTNAYFFQLSFWCNYTSIPSHHIIVQTGTTFPADMCLTSPSWADACCPRWHAWSVWWRCWGKGHWVWRGPYSPSSPGSAADTSSSREKAGSGPSWKPRKCGLLICRWPKIIHNTYTRKEISY